ncbi:carboxylesterase/lipase family protein [Streptomyces sp. NBC_01304]|uniref:carboxylesterase/lipase family protein n=1 Tax=Streptomyces sp. NBC_01304 TaxID=2903818 RepID=UPI002E10840C|nr:carboxylesterase family protein [Streptomyces sp. NBC_01304]
MPIQTSEVNTAYGKVSGIVEDGIARFLGIPYAAPPVGDLRFAAPQAPEPWTGVHDAYTYGPTPPKPLLDPESEMGKLMPEPSYEGDGWLNLNVWTPRPEDGAELPVMVWIHGGAFTSGSSAVRGYDGATFARDGVVCVSLNYRLGVEGFAYIEGADCPANRGLRDQEFALQWVRQNIARFGGNPDNVTVFGESAGAMSILAHLSRDTDLFHKAIVQSGTAHIAQTVEDAKLVIREIAKELGRPGATKADLIDVPMADLIKAQAAVNSDVVTNANKTKYGASTIASCGMSLMPVIDGDFLTQPPISAIAEGAGERVQLLLGTNSEEFRLFVMPTWMVAWTDPILFRVRLGQYGAPDGSYALYRDSEYNVEPYKRPKAPAIACAVLTDRMFWIPTIRIAEARANASAGTHVYEFGFRSPTVPNEHDIELGSSHALELPFMWDTLANPDSLYLTGAEPPQALADEMHQAWVGFASGGAPDWNAYDTEARSVMSFWHNDQAQSVEVHDPRRGEREHWDGELQAK